MPSDLVELMWWILPITVSLLSIFLDLIIFHLLALKQIFFVYVPEGEVMFVTVGEKLYKMLPNVKGWHLNPETGIMEPGDVYRIYTGPLGFLWDFLRRNLGLFWMGFYPWWRLYWYKFPWASWEDTKDAAGNIVERKIRYRDEPVNSLYWKYIYPVHVKEAELRDGILVDIYLSITVQAVRPYTPVFELHGDWFVPLSNAVAGAVADYTLKQTWNKFIKADKEGPTSPLTIEIMKINTDLMDQGRLIQGIVTATGMMVVAVNFENFEVSPNERQQAIEEATQAVTLAEKTAEAELVKAKKQAEGIKVVGEAEAERLEKLVKAGGKNGWRIVAAREQARELTAQGNLKVIGGNVLTNIGPDETSSTT